MNIVIKCRIPNVAGRSDGAYFSLFGRVELVSALK